MKLKRFLSVMLLFLFAFTMLPTSKVMADTTTKTGSLTITNDKDEVKSSSEYTAYQIITFDASLDSGGNTVYTNMKLNSVYRDTIISTLSIPGTPSDYQILTAVSNLTDAQTIAALAVALKGVAASPNYTAVNGVFHGLPYGYYLVIEIANKAGDGTVISKPILVAIPKTTTEKDVRVKVKTSHAVIEKKIVENSKLYDSSTAAVGDTVYYQSLSSIPTYPADATNITYYVTDTFSTGLAFQSESIIAKIVNESGTTVIKNLAPNTDYTLMTSSIGDATFRLKLNNTLDIKNWGNAGNKLLVTYEATLNANASFGNTGNPNSINLTYSNKPDSSDVWTTPDDTVITYTTKLEITKKDGDNKVLSGATFELYKEIGGIFNLIDTQSTDSYGKAYFTKLEQGTYQLKETVAPTGYNLLENPIQFTVVAMNDKLTIPDVNIKVTNSGNSNTADNFKATWSSSNGDVSVNDGKLSANIVNTKGFTLPGTGGIGTTIFTIVGISIILLGCSMLVVYFKRTKHLSSVK